MGIIMNIKSEELGRTYSNLASYKAQVTKELKVIQKEIDWIQEGVDRQEKVYPDRVALYLGEPAKPQIRAHRKSMNDLKAERAEIIKQHSKK